MLTVIVAADEWKRHVALPLPDATRVPRVTYHRHIWYSTTTTTTPATTTTTTTPVV